MIIGHMTEEELQKLDAELDRRASARCPECLQFHRLWQKGCLQVHLSVTAKDYAYHVRDGSEIRECLVCRTQFYYKQYSNRSKGLFCSHLCSTRSHNRRYAKKATGLVVAMNRMALAGRRAAFEKCKAQAANYDEVTGGDK